MGYNLSSSPCRPRLADPGGIRLDLSFRTLMTNWGDCDRAIVKAANAEGPALVFLGLPSVSPEIVPMDTWLKDAATAVLRYREQTAGLAGNTWPAGCKTADEVIAQCRKALADSPHTSTLWP